MLPAQLDKFTEAELRAGFRHQDDKFLHVGSISVAAGHRHRWIYGRAGRKEPIMLQDPANGCRPPRKRFMYDRALRLSGAIPAFHEGPQGGEDFRAKLDEFSVIESAPDGTVFGFDLTQEELNDKQAPAVVFGNGASVAGDKYRHVVACLDSA
jgi:hypothetical protein